MAVNDVTEKLLVPAPEAEIEEELLVPAPAPEAEIEEELLVPAPEAEIEEELFVPAAEMEEKLVVPAEMGDLWEFMPIMISAFGVETLESSVWDHYGNPLPGRRLAYIYLAVAAYIILFLSIFIKRAKVLTIILTCCLFTIVNVELLVNCQYTSFFMFFLINAGGGAFLIYAPIALNPKTKHVKND